MDSYAEQAPFLLDYVRAHIAHHPRELMSIAQLPSKSMTRALQMCAAELHDSDLLKRLFEALPVRTVQLRELAIQLASSIANLQPRTLENIALQSQYAARLREGGYAARGLELLNALINGHVFTSAPAQLKAHVYSNLGVCLADLGRDTESLEAHTAALGCLRKHSAFPDDREYRRSLASTLANSAAAAMRLSLYRAAETHLTEAEDLANNDDHALSFRISILRLTVMAENDRLHDALDIAVRLREKALDLEEIDNQAHRPAVVDLLVNLGSILLDLNQPQLAYDPLFDAHRLADGLAVDSPSPQTRLKRLTTGVAWLNASLLQGHRTVSASARALLKDSRELLNENQSAYAEEVHARALEIMIQSDTNLPNEIPVAEEIEEMLEFKSSENATENLAKIDQQIRALHVAAMAYSKRSEHHKALDAAQRAVQLSQKRLNFESLQWRAHHAVLLDSLSRRQFAVADSNAGLESAFNSVSIIVACWRKRPDAYQDWLERMLTRLHMLSEEHGEMPRFNQLMEDLRLTQINEN
ncbi:MAG: hypothetical protein MUE46_01600 [Xanthomonadales bacterium]|nr:hypothetical protein [Xanthomonadales bacterium]